jgi:hypothetical protein
MLILLNYLAKMLLNQGKKVIDEAKKKGMWLYDPTYKKWYSPEGFEHIAHYVNFPSEFFDTLQIRHPSEGIQAGFKRLTETQAKLEQFIKSVIEYYQKV